MLWRKEKKGKVRGGKSEKRGGTGHCQIRDLKHPGLGQRGTTKGPFVCGRGLDPSLVEENRKWVEKERKKNKPGERRK